MCTTRKLLLTVLTLLLICLSAVSLAEERRLTVLFTSDIHSFFSPSAAVIDGTLREHGGAGRLSTLISQNSNDHTILVDAGDFSQGTLLQAGYTTDAYELRLLGRLGYAATTFGNHEFDSGSSGAAAMLQAAMSSGEQLPVLLIPANLDLSGQLTGEQQTLADRLTEAGACRYIIREVDGVRVAVFGLMGKDAVLCAPTSGVVWQNQITSAREIVAQIGDQADVIICVSHSGTDTTGRKGEDVDLIKAVPGIDVVISGHAHVTHQQAIIVREGTVLGSCGAYLTYLGRIDLTVREDGTVAVEDYRLIPVDGQVAPDSEVDAVVDGYWQQIADGYLAGTGYQAQQVIAHTDFTLEDAITSQQIPLASLIADSYLYACRQAGYDDVEVAIVGMGTVRAPLLAGDITVEEAFEVCSLGMGRDGSTGHPLVSAWVKGSDLKLVAEMDAFIGPLYSAVVINYGGMEVDVDTGRVPFDRVTGLRIVHADGTTEPVQMDRMYRVTANMYAINMLGSIRSMTKGLITLNLLDREGNVIDKDHYYDYAVVDQQGREVKEWVALCDLLSSFEQVDGVPQIPAMYEGGTGRKTVVRSSIFGAVKNPGVPTIVVMVLSALLLLWVVTIPGRHRKRRIRRKARKEKKQQKIQNEQGK